MIYLTRRPYVLSLLAATLLQPSRRSPMMDAPQPPGRSLSGEIRLVPPGHPFKNADLFVTVENIAAADAPAQRIGRLRRKNVSYDGRPNSVLKFTMEGLQPPPGANCRIRVLVDLDGNGRISVGDYRSTRSYPVFTGHDPEPLVVEAEFKPKEP